MTNYSELFKELLKKQGLKYTTQRRVILDVLVEHEGQHLCSEEIYEMVKVRYPEIGIATVYRTMLLLEKFKIVYKIDSEDMCSRYALAGDREGHTEHNIACMQCGKVSDIRKSIYNRLENEVLKYQGFKTKNHKIKLYGYCKNCR